MQYPEKELIALLKETGVDFTASLPCERIKNLLVMVQESFQHIPLTREEEGVGICAGAALSGMKPALFVQSSGIGNMINALLSLTEFYRLPLALFISRRGIYKEKIAAQIPLGRRLPAILDSASLSYTLINSTKDFRLIAKKLPDVYQKNRIHAFLLSPAIWDSEGSMNLPLSVSCIAPSSIHGRGADGTPLPHEGKKVLKPSLTRFEILSILAPFLDSRVVVCNLGIPSKELYHIRHQSSHFYMLGSMGLATPIGLGIALATKKQVVVIDGDGSLLMNPGSLATAAYASPRNLTILAIDNGSYGSTGDQPTLTRSCVDLEIVARGFGIRRTYKVSDRRQLTHAFRQCSEGMTFIHALAVPGNKNVPNIPLHHLEIRRQVQGFIMKSITKKGEGSWLNSAR